MNELQLASENNTRALKIGEQLLREDPKHADEWRRLVISCHTGLGDAIQAGNHERRDVAAYRAAGDHYERAVPMAEQLVAANPDSVPDLIRLAKVYARIAGMLPALDIPEREPVHFRESIRLHDRNRELLEKALQLDPGNSQVRRNIAGGLIAKAYARCIATQNLEEAAADSGRAIEMFQPLADADPLNAEAQQDLSYAHYVKGWAHHLHGDHAQAAPHYRISIGILEPLVQRHPDNLETAYDLDQARRRLAEIETRAAAR
jgi:tetratricopeptide (TPR) repeat protein